MKEVTLTINGHEIVAPDGTTILEADKGADIYSHPLLPSGFAGCQGN